MKHFLWQHGYPPASAHPSQSPESWPRPCWNEKQTSTQNIASCTLTWLQIVTRFWQQTQYFAPTDNHLLSLPSLWVVDCLFSIIDVKYEALSRLWSGCFHVSVYPLPVYSHGSAVWQINIIAGSFLGVFLARSLRYSGTAGLPAVHKKKNVVTPLSASRRGCAQPPAFALRNIKISISASYSGQSQQLDRHPCWGSRREC